MPNAATASSLPAQSPKKTASTPDKKYKCQFCARAFSRSEHRSRHERSRKLAFPFFFIYLVVGGVKNAVPWWGIVAFCAERWLTSKSASPHNRYERTSLQMHEMSQYLCQKRPPPSTRSHRPCQRWRRPPRQRSQTEVNGKGHNQGHSDKT